MSDILLCITAGRGPVECQLAVQHVVRALEREAEAIGLSFGQEPSSADGSSVLVAISGGGADILARSWIGTIQWIARSTLRPDHKRKNWFVAVHRLEEPQRAPRIAASDLRFEALRAGGPGGQHQNTTSSAIRAVHQPTGLSVVARDERSQHRNKTLAVDRLNALFGALEERAQNQAAFKEWQAKIDVNRGNPVRTYEGEGFLRRG